MNVRDFVRIAILKTNSLWPFSTWNKVPYRFAVRAFIQAFKVFPEIRSIYLRHGLVERTWVPAVSDIDFTLIISSQMTDEQEFAFLRNFWKRYRTFKKLFPMLGEIEILNEQQFGSFTKFKIWGYESFEWKLVHGQETLKSNYLATPFRLKVDSLNHAVWFYLDFLLQRFYDNAKPAYLISCEMRRIASKVLRYANYNSRDEMKVEEEIPREKAEIVCFVLKRLDQSVYEFLLQHKTTPVGSDWNQEWRRREFEKVPDNGFVFNELIPFRNTIKSILLSSYNRDQVLLDAVSDIFILKSCINSIRDSFAGQERTPTLITSGIFEYMMRFFDPYLYTHLMKCSRVAMGDDILPGIQPPDPCFFAQKVLYQVPTLLIHSRSEKLILPLDSNRYSEKAFESIINRGLFIKLYLEKGVLCYRYSDLMQETHRNYPDVYERLRKCASSGLESFRLMRSITTDIHNALQDSRKLQDLYSMNV